MARKRLTDAGKFHTAKLAVEAYRLEKGKLGFVRGFCRDDKFLFDFSGCYNERKVRRLKMQYDNRIQAAGQNLDDETLECLSEQLIFDLSDCVIALPQRTSLAAYYSPDYLEDHLHDYHLS